MIFLRYFALTALVLLLPKPGWAQVRAQDYQRRASGLEAQRFATPDFSTSLNHKVMNKRFATPEISQPMSRFDGRRSQMDGQENAWQQRLFPVRAYGPAEKMEARDFHMHRQAADTPRLDNIESIRANTISARFSTEKAKPYGAIPPLFSNEETPFSLADINRLNFRRGHSREPGLPVQEAGSSGR